MLTFGQRKDKSGGRANLGGARMNVCQILPLRIFRELKPGANETSIKCRSNVYGLQRVNAAGGHYLEGGTDEEFS